MGLLIPLLMIALNATAETSCLPEFTSLQTVEVVRAGEPSTTKLLPLKSESVRGRFDTKAMLGVTNVGRVVELQALFDPKFEGVSLAYNLYAVQVIRDGEVVLWEDYTAGCAGPGLSFFPGRTIDLPAIKLPDDKLHRLHILIWGKL